MSFGYAGGPQFQYNPYQGYNPYPNNAIANPQSSAFNPRYFTQSPSSSQPTGPQSSAPQPSAAATSTAADGASIQAPQVSYNVDVQSQGAPPGSDPISSTGGAAPVQVEPLPYIDPFAQTELGQLLRMISSGFSRSPYGSHLGQGQQVGGLPFGQGGGSAQPIQQRSGPVQYQPQEYLAPVGPLEHTFRSQMIRQLFGNDLYAGHQGPGRSLSYRPSGYGGAASLSTHTPAMYPETWDPYKGLFQWNGATWSPTTGGY